MVAQQRFLEEGQELPVADALVVLGAGDGELLGRDAPVEQVPGPGLLLACHALAQPMRVKAGDQGLGTDALAPVVQPQGGLARNGGQAMAGEVRERVRKARRVVPHLASVGDLCSQLVGGQVVQPAVGKGMRAVEHGFGLRPVAGPVAPRLLMAAVDAAHGQHDGWRAQVHLGTRGLVDGQRAADPPIGVFELRHAVAVQQRQLAAAARRTQLLNQAQRHAARSAPQQVVARHAVALAVPAALDQIHRGHELHALLQQPVVNLCGRMLDVVTRPGLRPAVVGVELTKTLPIGQRPRGAVGDLFLGLQPGAHQRHAAKGPQGQAAETLGAVAIDQSHAAPGAQRLQRGDDAGQAAAHDHQVCLQCCHVFVSLGPACPFLWWRR